MTDHTTTVTPGAISALGRRLVVRCAHCGPLGHHRLDNVEVAFAHARSHEEAAA